MRRALALLFGRPTGNPTITVLIVLVLEKSNNICPTFVDGLQPATPILRWDLCFILLHSRAEVTLQRDSWGRAAVLFKRIYIYTKN